MGLAFDLQCSSIWMNKLIEGKMFNRCRVKNLQITQRGQEMTSAYLINNLSAIQGLYCYSLTVNFVPRIGDELAKHLKSLVIDWCHLKEIKQEDLEQFPELVEISLHGNDLTTLPGNLFDRNRKIEKFDLGYNKFKTIGAEVLEPLKSLTIAYIWSAGCVSFVAFNQNQVDPLKEKLKACR
jgi:Leucine rich repeat